ncbi:MAG: hypothetical protein Q7R92_03815 [bacterium]|nr:hypothetical protein [bacterium]
MKITISGCMTFAEQMLAAQKVLQELGHTAYIPVDTELCVKAPELSDNLEHCQTYSEIDLDKDHFNKIADSDAILVLNYPKNNIDGYIGGATLMEIGVARHLDKKIFILHELPPKDALKYVLEIQLAKPIILEGDINNIIQHTL